MVDHAARIGQPGFPRVPAQRSGDYSTPQGSVPNSQSDSKSGGASLALTGEHGFLGASYQYVDTRSASPSSRNARRHCILAGIGSISGWNGEASLLRRRDQAPGRLRGYKHEEIDRFILPFQTGETDEEGLTVIAYRAGDSRFRGFEAHVDVGLTEDVWLVLGGDRVYVGSCLSAGRSRRSSACSPPCPPFPVSCDST